MKVLFIAPIGNFNVKDGGYGNASLGMLKVLQRMKDDDTITYLDEVDCISTLDISKIKVPEKKYDVVLMVTSPMSFMNTVVNELFTELLNLGEKRYLSLVWETEPLPELWNFLWRSDLFTGFVTPSYFVGNQIKRNTLKPVYYNPHYIDIDLFKPIDIEEKIKENKFTVLFMGQDTKRKSIDEAIISYIRAMHVHKDTQMVVKYHSMTGKELPLEPLIKNWVTTNCSKWESNIYSLTDDLSNEEVIKLYQNSSLLLFPSKGEGFGLPLAEAMSIGIPVVYTDWSACPEVAKGPGNIPVEFYLDETICMNSYGYEYGSKYAYPIMSSLTDAVRTKYNKWKKSKREYYEEVKDNRLIIDKKFGYESVKTCMDIILNDRTEKKI